MLARAYDSRVSGTQIDVAHLQSIDVSACLHGHSADPARAP
jgi:hypothetical protein